VAGTRQRQALTEMVNGSWTMGSFINHHPLAIDKEIDAEA